MANLYGQDPLGGGEHGGPWPALADLLAATTLVFFVLFAVTVVPGIRAQRQIGETQSTIKSLHEALTRDKQFEVKRIGDYLRITIGGDAVFDRDRSDLASMKVMGRLKLEALARVLRDSAILARIDQIHIVGHTSSEGGSEHNWRLSSERAGTVALLLIGPVGKLPACKVTALGRGRYYPVRPARAKSSVAPAEEDRRIEVEIRPSIVKDREQDLRSKGCVERVGAGPAP